MLGSQAWTEHGTFDTLYTADAAEFCPIEKNQSFFAVGTYQLNKEEQKRVGRLWLFEAQQQGENDTKKHKMTERSQLQTQGILDLKWNYRLLKGTPVLAGANAGPELALWSLTDDGENKSLVPIDSQSLGEPLSSIYLSLDWNNRIIEMANPSIVVSQSDHKVSIWECGQAGVTCTDTWDAHEHEVWISAFNYWQPQVVFSGSDDCFFNGWDLRTDKQRPIFSKRHDMGVTTMQTHPHCEHYLATGSYDENVSLWDLRMMTRREPLKKVAMGGGVWRIKWHPSNASRMLVACMHNGFKVLDWEDTTTATKLFTTPQHKEYIHTCEIDAKELVHFTQHGEGQLGYGADWSHHPESSNLAATCSFYNHMCILWELAK